ncbi:MAG: class I SAM-dependent methyltransferase, partial [Pseudomonadota bacterium]|nr:class I SAM-dependent methyltransferase [Pseudomonadota bacterium]
MTPPPIAPHHPPAAAALRKARFWNRTARRYARDAIADPAGYEKTLQRVIGLLSPGHRVLEIGCGTGATALRLAPHVRRLLATDVSPEMIAIAHERLQAQPMPQLSFAVADADLVWLGVAVHDRVLAFNLLHLVDDLDGTLAAAAQALRPGGLLISKTPCLAEMNPLITR